MAEKVEYEVLATLKSSGSLGKQMKMLMGSSSAVGKNLDKIQASMGSAGRAIMGTTAQTAAGWAKAGGTMAVVAGGAGMGGLLHQGLAFNESMESSKNTIGAMYQLYGQNQSNILKNLTQAELVQKNLFDLAKRAPGEYEDAVNVYKGAAKGLTVANESIAEQMKFMESAIMLPQVVGGGLNSDVVGGQLGRIIMGGAGAEFETWKVLAPAILKAGQEMKGLNGQAQIFKDSMRPNADLTMAWNALAQDNPKVAMEVLKRAVVPLKELAPVFETAWEGVLGTTMSNMKMITGAFTKPFFEMRKAFLIRMNKSGIFSDQSIGKLQHIAAVMGILFIIQTFTGFSLPWMTQDTVATLIGRGNGLTPAGDDALAGALLVACALCGHLHAIDWSPWCSMCWGDLRGEVPGDRADDGEVCDGC